MTQTFKLSPSDLTFLWDECRRCFYFKVARNQPRPSSPFPAIFTRIDRLMKDHFGGQSTSAFTTGLPPGRIRFGESWVTSQPIALPGRASQCFIKGKFDTLVDFDDGSHGVVDFKTSQPKQEHVDFYSRQLHAYRYALEHPAPGAMRLSPISRLGLLVVEPVEMTAMGRGRVAYLGEVTWQECPLKEDEFLAFLGQVVAVLEQPEPPPASPSCAWCKYEETVRAR
jgi:hypothetical protein